MNPSPHSTPQFNREAFILFRMPGSKQLIYQILDKTKILDVSDSNQAGDGFVFAPFDMEAHPMYFFTARETKSYSDLTKLRIPTSSLFLSAYDGESITKPHYLNKLRQTIQVIREEEETHKIVLSRSFFKSEKKFENFGPFFNRLLSAYPQSFVYLLNHPEIGTWCGASPELLFSSNLGQCQTVALASTRRIEAFGDEQVAWNEKEVDEQQLVEHYIEEKLDHKVATFHKTGPDTIYSGRLAHICSYYRFKIPKVEEFGFVKELHPTPAVCGLPKQVAQNHLAHLEAYDREYYSGFLGPIGVQQASSMYVNLRCFKVYSNGLNIFAGGGITKDSVPELEWTETCNKLDSILRLL